MTTRVYIDSDVLIWNLRGHAGARRLLSGLAADPDVEVWTSAMQRAEVLFFIRPGEEAITFELLERIQTEPVTETIVDLAAEMFREWQPRSGIDMNDAILAGTVGVTGGRIVTQNIRHFSIPGISASRGW